jgi:CubicO group peptidase (beta-lactamase class C family)
MLTRVRSLLTKEIDHGNIPGAVLHISYQQKVILQEAFGYRAVLPDKREMQVSTVFDLASLTKVVATLPVILKLMEYGEITLSDPVIRYIPLFGKHRKESITLFHLLTHTSGLPAHRPFYLEATSMGRLDPSFRPIDYIIKKICEEPLEAPIGKKVVYSDLGLILLYKIIEMVTEQRFEDFVKREIFTPLEMYETGFNPVFPKERYAVTEFSKHLQEFKTGIVHDDNAESMGGISGHAGLFSTVQDLSKYAQMIENDGYFNGKKILSSVSIHLSRRNYSSFDQEYRGLGWILQRPVGSSCGELFSEQSYGHTGFTGTSIWFDPTLPLHVILLTNRVHFGRTDAIMRLRPRIHNLIRSHIQ